MIKYDHGQPAIRTLIILLVAAVTLLGWMTVKGMNRAAEIIHEHQKQDLQEAEVQPPLMSLK